MKTYKFKTNINCSSCVAKVTPFMEKLDGINSWNVDTANQDKVLEVSSDSVSEGQIIDKVKEAGFKIEPAKKGFLDNLF
ncbi:heavy-metal-associated domain-containing protein [Rapidithrix thailandica]|uniref:Heavy-metal-associated domain-containing protein n=1 Tax=Rapidithrix thailandica TaxID=413964 RepID=A0AAW9S5H5_9BACT